MITIRQFENPLSYLCFSAHTIRFRSRVWWCRVCPKYSNSVAKESHSSNPLLLQCAKLLKLNEIYNLKITLHIYSKCSNRNFSTHADIYMNNTRNRDNIVIPRCHRSKTQLCRLICVLCSAVEFQIRSYTRQWMLKKI